MKMFVKNKPVTTVAGLLFALGGAMLAVPALPVCAAPLVPTASKAEGRIVEDGIETATTSRVLSLALPNGANRLTDAEVLARFDKELQEGVRTLNGSVTRFEVLMWTGDAAKSSIGEVSTRLKDMGYSTGEPTTFDTEAGRVTPVGALRGDKSDSVMGMWIETKEGAALLVWGRFKPNTTPASDISEKPVTTEAELSKPSAVSNKAAAKPKKVAVAAKPKPGKSSASSSKTARPETDAERQAKAFQAYKDYQYVKMMGPISGPMYRSTKW